MLIKQLGCPQTVPTSGPQYYWTEGEAFTSTLVVSKAPTSFENKDGVQIHFSILNEIFLLVFNTPLIILFVDWLYFHGFSYFSWNILIIFSYLREKKKS